MGRFKRFAAITAVAVGMAVAPSIASADIQTTYYNSGPTVCSCIATFDGYTFVGYPYVDAANIWIALYNTPGYVSQPPVTSISTTTTVSGTVAEPVATVAPQALTTTDEAQPVAPVRHHRHHW